MRDGLTLHDLPEVWNWTLIDREAQRRVEQMTRDHDDFGDDDEHDPQEPWA